MGVFKSALRSTFSATILVFSLTTRLDAADSTALLEQRVDLRGCAVALSPVVSGNAFYQFARIEGVDVSFVNRGPDSLNAVTFQVRYNGETQTVTDRGTFSPGVRIDHRLGALQSEPYAGSQVSCRVFTYGLRANDKATTELHR